MFLWTFAPSKSAPILTTFMQNKPNFKAEDRRQKSEDRNQTTEDRRRMTEDSKISAKSTPKLRFSVPTNFFYNCRESSTNRPCFMQNKPNFQKSQMDVTFIITKDYEKKSNRTFGKNKPKQSQFQTGCLCYSAKGVYQ